MKFKLRYIDKIVVGNRTEDRYRYESDDGRYCQFHADSRPWNWVVVSSNIGSGDSTALIEKFCEMALNDANPDFGERVKELEIQL